MKKELLIALLASFAGLCSCGQSSDRLTAEARELWNKHDYEKAVPLYLKAANSGNAEAQYAMGICYENGRATEKNDSIARTWFLKSAQNGYAEAQLKMSLATTSPRDNYKESFFWLKKCAENNDPSCMQGVAGSYESGRGTERNMDSMMVWLKRLALIDDKNLIELKGHSIANARFKLAEIYKNGEYVTKDLTEAYAWFLVYNECKFKLWEAAQKENLTTIRDVAEKLSGEQLYKANERAASILNRPLKEADNLYKTSM